MVSVKNTYQEETFVRRLQKRERKAYVELYDFYFKRLHNFAVHYVFDDEVAKDIVQTVLIKLYERIADFRGDTNLGAYLTVMVRNSCLNYLRDRGVEDHHKILYWRAVQDAGALEWLGDDELIEKVRMVVSALPDKYRQICELRFYRNLKFSEIAELLSVSENVVKVQVHRAVQKIRVSLGDYDGQIIGLLMFYNFF